MTRIGIVAALPAEARSFSGQRHAPTSLVELDGGTVLVHTCGLGRRRAAGAAQALLARGARALVSWGTAGALDPSCRAGDLLLPDTLRTVSGESFATDPDWLQRLAQRLAPHLTVRTGMEIESADVVGDPEDKLRRLHSTGALGVDMESAAVAAEGHAAGVPFLAVRAVADAAGTAIPRCALAGIDPSGRLRPLAFLAALCRQPGEVGAVVRLRRACRVAERTLRAAVRHAGRQLLLAP